MNTNPDKYSSATTASNVANAALDPAVAKVLRSTYTLLGITLAFSALMAGISMAINAPYFGLWYLAAVGSGPIMMALGSTALVFFGASAYVLTTRKNLSFMTGFLMTGILVAFIAGIANIFLKIPALSITVSSVFAFLSAGIIMWQTSAIIHGGERNYISATVTLFVMIYNLFLSLLQLFGIMSDD